MLRGRRTPRDGVDVKSRTRVGIACLAAIVGPLATAAPALATAPTWSTAVAIGKSNGGSPTLAMNSAGTAIAEWGRTTATVGSIYASVAAAGQPWAKGSAVGGTSAYDSSRPSVALDESGAALGMFSAYQIDSLSNAYISGFRFANGTSGGYQIVASPVAGLGSIVHFAGTSTTTINDAVALTPTAKPCNLWVSVNPSDNYWTVESNLSTECITRDDFALDRGGFGVVAFVTASGKVEVATRAPDGTWSTPTVLTTASNVAKVAVAVDAAGDASVVYSTGKAKPFTVSAATRPAAGVWSAPTVLSAGACNGDVATTTTATGTMLAAWSQSQARHCEVAADFGNASAGFAGVVTITAGARATAVAATVTAGGQFVLAWNNAATASVEAATGTTAGFDPPAVVGPGGRPLLAAGGGSVSAVWCQTTCYGSHLSLS